MDKIIDEPSGVRGADQFVGLYPPSLRSFTYKFAWYYGDPQEYSGRLVGKTVGASRTVVGFVEIIVDDAVLLVINGAELKGIGTYWCPSFTLGKNAPSAADKCPVTGKMLC
ncbi:MAG TPA: hypothetical protein VHV83_15085 [Armatimonadota bacterium]|nr:hypothetical protein [Armatimonadota bacterium]